MPLTDLIAMLLFASTSSFMLLYVLTFKPGDYHYTFFPVPRRSATAWLFPVLHFAGAVYLAIQAAGNPAQEVFKTPSSFLVTVCTMYLLSLMVEMASHRAKLLATKSHAESSL